MRQVLLVFTVFAVLVLSANEPMLQISADEASVEQKFKDFLPEKFVVCNVEYQSDVDLDSHELDYLVDLQCDQSYKVSDLCNALFYLQQSQKFESINLKIRSQSDGYHVLFDLVKNKIVSRVAVSGLLRGKQQIKNHYLIELGQCFDQQKHQHCLDQMMRYLQDRGYFNAKITDDVDVDSETKAVKIWFKINKSWRFKIVKRN